MPDSGIQTQCNCGKKELTEQRPKMTKIASREGPALEMSVNTLIKLKKKYARKQHQQMSCVGRTSFNIR